MGKKRSAARRAAATAAPAPALAPTASPAVPFDTHAALVDTPPAPAVRESPASTQQPRVSHEADATRAPRAALPAQPTIDVSLDLEPATAGVHATTPVAIATPQTHERHASDPCPEPEDSPPASTTPTSTSNDVSVNAPQQSRISNPASTLIAPRTPIPASSASATAAVAVLAAAIDVLGSPTVFLACPMHSFDRTEDYGHELDVLAPRVCPAMTTEEVDEDLLENIIEDAQNQTRIEARREVRVKALQEGRERGWKEGLEEGKEIARREARRGARAEVRQREQSWKDGYEQGRWEGYREGLEVARAEVSTTPRIDATVQADDAIPPHPRSIERSPANPRVDAHVQTDNPPCPHSPPLPSPSRARSPPPIPLDTVPATSHASADVQTDDHAPTLSPRTSACTTTPRVDAGVQSDAPTRALAPTPRIHVGVQAGASTSPRSIPIDMTASPHLHVGIQADAAPSPIARIHASVQADDPAPLSPPDDTHSPPRRIQASAQTDTPRTSAPARARTPHEIEPVLLREIIATASARGEAAGLKQWKHTGFQDGMEAGWKSGTREGREEGYTEGKKDGINEGYERHRLEVSHTPRAVAVVQTDNVPFSTYINSTTQTVSTSTMRPANPQHCTIVSLPAGTVNTPSNSIMTSSNDVFTSNNDCQNFSWADEASSLPITSAAPLISPPPRDLSILRSSSARPFDSLKRRARRSQARPTRPSCPLRLFIPSSEPIVTRRHPAGLRADRPSVIISSSPLVPNSVKLEAPPLDWQGDPRLQELGRVLRGLGWIHVSGS